jgi:hypothetical protein
MGNGEHRDGEESTTTQPACRDAKFKA